MQNFLKFILSRAVVVYLLFALIIWRVMDYHQLINNAVPQTMSRLTPPMDYFAEFVNRDDHFNQIKLMNCVNYHQAVAGYFPFQKAEALGMMGFCYERLGKEGLAVNAYRQAINANPDYFWPYFDLGVIYYRQGKYPEAIDALHQAIDQPAIKTVFLVSRSKVYNDVKLSQAIMNYDLLEGIKDGRQQAYILLMDSLFRTGAHDQLGNVALFGLKEGLDLHGIFYYYAGVAAFYQKSYEQAMVFLKTALQANADNADALLYMGMCMHAAGKEDMAQMMMNKASVMHQQGSWLEPILKTRVRFF